MRLDERVGCHLCEEAHRALRRVGLDMPLAITRTDIAADPTLERRYVVRIPVLRVGSREPDPVGPPAPEAPRPPPTARAVPALQPRPQQRRHVVLQKRLTQRRQTAPLRTEHDERDRQGVPHRRQTRGSLRSAQDRDDRPASDGAY